MRPDEQLTAIEGELRAAFTRMTWRDFPTARLRYTASDDCLIVELVENDPLDEIVALDRLLVEFDGTDPYALPVTIVLARPWAEPDQPVTRLAREVLGDRLWESATGLADQGEGEIELALDADEAEACLTRWAQLAMRLRDPVWVHTVAFGAERVLGVEFVPGRVHLVLADSTAVAFDEETVNLQGNEPHDVVAAVVEAVEAVANRHSAAAVHNCPVGVQLGGPVDSATGVVEHYDKPLREGDEAWKGVPLGELLAEATGRQVRVFNDATAFAEYEVMFGSGRDYSKVAILVVRQGVGAKLIFHGEVVDEFPMEIGVFVPVPDVDLTETPAPTDRARQSIEAESGVLAIVAAVQEATGLPCTTIEDAAHLAEAMPEAERLFWNAGAGIARMMAAAQAFVNPELWVVHGPDALVDGRRGARAFQGALARRQTHLDYTGFLPGRIEVRSTSGSLGARAAAVAMLNDARKHPTARRNDLK